MKIAIVGAKGEGKTTFLDSVLLPSLLQEEHTEYGLKIQDDGYWTVYRAGSPTLTIATFTDPRQAAAWLEAP